MTEPCPACGRFEHDPGHLQREFEASMRMAMLVVRDGELRFKRDFDNPPS